MKKKMIFLPILSMMMLSSCAGFGGLIPTPNNSTSTNPSSNSSEEGMYTTDTKLIITELIILMGKN